ncbi:MAG: YhjD/YihY/BrkB family envelope integrity protein, partial [Candidatus Sericytochromatia bacterium]
MRVSEATDFLKETFRQWSADKASRLGAALSYYSIFSIGPLLVIAIGIAGMVLGTAGAQAQMTQALEGTIGVQGAEAIATMIAGAAPPGGGLVATVVGLALLVFAASGVIIQLQDAL